MIPTVVELINNKPRVTIHSSEDAARAYALEIALENTGYTEEEIRDHLKTRGVHEEGEWAVHVTQALAHTTEEPCRVTICEVKSHHEAWGIYDRKAGSSVPYKLAVVRFAHEGAAEGANQLAAQFPDKEYLTFGAANSDALPNSI